MKNYHHFSICLNPVKIKPHVNGGRWWLTCWVPISISFPCLLAPHMERTLVLGSSTPNQTMAFQSCRDTGDKKFLNSTVHFLVTSGSDKNTYLGFIQLPLNSQLWHLLGWDQNLTLVYKYVIIQFLPPSPLHHSMCSVSIFDRLQLNMQL